MQKKPVSSRPVWDAYRYLKLSAEQMKEIRETLLRDAREFAHCLGESADTICSAVVDGEIHIQVLENRHGVRCLYLQYEDAWIAAPFTILH